MHFSPSHFLPFVLLAFLSGAVVAVKAHRAAPPQVAAGWEVDVLRGLGNAEPTQETVDYLGAWHRAEGGTATYNWLNTTQPMVGDSLYNSVGVRNYPDYATGVAATVKTLTNGFYPRTLAGLQTNQPVVDDGEMGVWGTGGGAIRAQLEETQDARAAIVAYALSLNGIPYVRGGRSASGGDCSGTMQHVYLHITGIDIGATTFSQFPQLAPVAFEELQPGDLWFGQYSNDQHVGMVADVDGDGAWDLINNGGLESAMHVDYGFLDQDYFAAHTMGFRRAL